MAVIGVGNVASAFVQGIYAKRLPGLWHQKVGVYTCNDIEVVAAYDIDNRKIGLSLSDALFKDPNVGPHFVDIPRSRVVVQKGIIQDPSPSYIAANVDSSDSIVDDLIQSRVDLALNLIPSGMPKSSASYALH